MSKATITIPKLQFVAVGLVTIGLLLIPLIAMHFTSEVKWDIIDFIIMGTIIFTSGFLVDLATRKAGKYRAIAIFGIILLFVWLWAELAVGIFTNWGN